MAEIKVPHVIVGSSAQPVFTVANDGLPDIGGYGASFDLQVPFQVGESKKNDDHIIYTPFLAPEARFDLSLIRDGFKNGNGIGAAAGLRGGYRVDNCFAGYKYSGMFSIGVHGVYTDIENSKLGVEIDPRFSFDWGVPVGLYFGLRTAILNPANAKLVESRFAPYIGLMLFI